MTEIKIVTPTGMFGASSADDFIDTAMRIIGVGFGQPDEWSSKYGTDYENDVFMMHRYCWCEKPECLWCTIWLSNEVDCTEAEAEAHRGKQVEQVRQRFGAWAAEHPSAPHFWFKPTGFQLRWYKYIGRDMEFSDECLPKDFLDQIFATHTKGMTAEQAYNEMARREDENAKGFAAMMASLNAKFA